MKIAVITPYDSANFGAYLQAYCLKVALEGMGHEVFHIPTRDSESVKALYVKKHPTSKREKLFPLRFHKENKYGAIKYEIFSKAHKLFACRSLEEMAADLYVLGSDEIWNINKPAFTKSIFWGQDMASVIAYAPSIAEAKPEDYCNRVDIINALRNMRTILVRDERTKEMVKKAAGVDAEIVCDPTLLHPLSNYEEVFDDPYVKEHDCLLVYAYRLSIKQQRTIRAVAKKLGMKIVTCCFYHPWADHQCICTPLQFGSLIRSCKAVITTTFHGSILSMQNHANFVSIPANPKTEQLLKQFHLENRCVSDWDSNKLHAALTDEKVDYDRVDERINSVREKSLALLKDAINNACNEKKRFSYQICTTDNCTGCFACKNKCPVQAISEVTDVEGRTLPLIDPEKCIQCGLCKRICPQNTPAQKREPQACYAAQRREGDTRGDSSSGGIGAVMMDYVILQGGVVYGAVAAQTGDVRHIRGTTLEQTAKMRKSKYVQSDTDGVYPLVLEDIKAGKQVLFTGAPCQIAGLQAFLGREYENLYCVDLVCHGVPPMKYLEDHIKSRIGETDYNDIAFRGGAEDFCLTVKKDEQTLYCKNKWDDVYYFYYLKLAISRENCYHCRYADKNRISDITIGDFWGIDRNTLQSGMSGKISLILVNTDKGMAFLEKIRPQLTIEEREIEEAVAGNPQLRGAPKTNVYRRSFLKAYRKKQSFESAISSRNLWFHWTKTRLKRFLGKSLVGRGAKAARRLITGKQM